MGVVPSSLAQASTNHNRPERTTNTMNTTNTLPDRISNDDLIKGAGSNIEVPQVTFQHAQFDGTKAFKKSPIESIDAYSEAIHSQYEQVERHQVYEGYTAAEIRVALAEVLSRRVEGVSKPVSNDPRERPSTMRVSVGYSWETGQEEFVVVPESTMSLPGFNNIPGQKKWQPVIKVIRTSSGPALWVNILRGDQALAEGIFEMVTRWVKGNSIYLGQVVDVNFDFLNMTKSMFNPEDVAVTETLEDHITNFVTGPMRYGDTYKEFGVPRKSGLFLYGPPGGGKTMAMSLCAYFMARLGACVVIIDPSLGMDGLRASEKRTQKLLENGHKVGICMEDMEKLAREDRAKVLDILDGTNSKGARRTFIGTTNFLEQIDRAMLRPGRFDAVEFCGLPDRQAFEHLLKVLFRDRDDLSHVDFDLAFPAFEGYSYAFMAQATQNVVRSAINRNQGEMEGFKITTEDLIYSANSVRGHFELMQEQVEETEVTIDSLFKGAIEKPIAMSKESIMEKIDYTDNTSYGRIEELIGEQADAVIEARLDGAKIDDQNRLRTL